MKSLISIGAFVCCLAVGQYAYADYSAAPAAPAANGACCPQPQEQACGEQSTGECYCLYVKYEPCYYTTKRCVETQVPCTKKCYRKVPKYYEVQRCRMVPQYYTETCCKYENECYEVADTKCCKEYVCDTHCRYVPKYYWKHTCGNNNVVAPQDN